MIIKKTKFKGLLIIKQKNNTDSRGNLRETFNDKILKKKFIFEYCTTSKINIFRGFHFQTKNKQSKFVNVLKGKILDIVIDLRKKSNDFHARHSAILRTYEYLIINRQGSLSINKNRAWHVKKKINFDLFDQKKLCKITGLSFYDYNLNAKIARMSFDYLKNDPYITLNRNELINFLINQFSLKDK